MRCTGRIAAPDQEVSVQDRALRNFGIFVLVLVGMKVLFGWNISIIGSIVLTIIVSVAISAFNRR